MPIKIDSITYDVGIVDLSFNIEKLYKNAERSQSGILHKELIGVFYNYPRVVMGLSQNNVTDYFALVNVLTDTNEFHSVTMPDIDGVSDIVFDAYFDSITQRVKKWVIGTEWHFAELTCAIIAKGPARTP